jgi:aspartate dehydrogenase
MKVGIIGCGFIGSTLARYALGMPEIEAVHILESDLEKARAFAGSNGSIHVFTPSQFKGFLSGLDLVIEAASQEAVATYSEKVLMSGTDMMVLSVGALASGDLWPRLKAVAHAQGANLYVPSGAVAGLDGLGAASVRSVKGITLVTTKPTSGFKGVRYLEERGIDPSTLKAAMVVFDGPAVEAIKAFPKNINVAATIGLCACGLEKVKVRIVADPQAHRNKHHVEAEGDFGRMTMDIENVPSENPSTSMLAALSAISALKKIVGRVWVGI